VAIQDEIPKSRLTLTYRTTINGAMQDISLPFRILVLADFSQGTSVDRKVDLSERKLRPLTGRNLDPLIKDMKMRLRTTVKNCVDPENSETIDVDLPIEAMKSFAPDEIAYNIPKVRALLMLKQLLLETQASIDNRKDLRKIVQEIYSKPEVIPELVEKFDEFKGLRLPATSQSSTTQPSGN
jgi:type VI secretion system protein ImpB